MQKVLSHLSSNGNLLRFEERNVKVLRKEVDPFGEYLSKVNNKDTIVFTFDFKQVFSHRRLSSFFQTLSSLLFHAVSFSCRVRTLC